MTTIDISLLVADPAADERPFAAVVSNPPYQTENDVPLESNNVQPPVSNVFHYHQAVSLELGHITTMVYPAGRWIQKSGKGMKPFGDMLLNHPHLVALYTYAGRGQNALFSEMKIHDGLSVVFTNGYGEPSATFNYNGYETPKPGDGILPLSAELSPIIAKILNTSETTLRDTFSARTLYGIESTYVELHPERVVAVSESPLPPSTMAEPTQLLTNDKGGPTGRTRWYWVERSELTSTPLLGKHQAVIESGVKQSIVETKGMSWVHIGPNQAHGRVKASAAWFETETELENFLKYVSGSRLIRRLIAESASNLSSFGAFVPHLSDYSDGNPLFDDSDGPTLDDRLIEHFQLTATEVSLLLNRP